MAETYWGADEDFVTESINISVDEIGVCSISETLLCKDEATAQGKLSVVADDCPLPLTRPYVKGTNSNRTEAGWWKVVRNYSAVISTESEDLLKLYELETVANNEPIQTHPDFNDFAGDPSAPLNGAVFDPVAGDFLRFTPYAPDGSKNRKSGIKDYKVPIINFTETRVVFEEELGEYIRGAGFVDDSPPDSPLRPRFSKRNWLLTECAPEWVAEGAYRLRRKWACSGPRGWDRDIYPEINIPK